MSRIWNSLWTTTRSLLINVYMAFRSNPYGWVMVCVAALAMVATIPGRTHGLGMITERLLADPAFEMDRRSYANMNLWASLLGGLFCLPCGYLIDRFGLKLTLTVTVAALGAVSVAMTQLAGWWALFGSLVLTRGFGQSALSVISITMVGKWFHGRITMPMAVYTLLLSLGWAYAFQLAEPLKDYDWRVLWSRIGWTLLLGMAPLALLLTRDPVLSESTNLNGTTDEPSQPLPGAEVGFTLAQAMRTQAFWLFGLAISVIALIGSGTSLFNESVLKQQGFSNTVYYKLGTFIPLVGLIFKLPVGWLGLHCRLNQLHAAGLFLLAACLMGLPYIHTEFGITVYGVGMGISGTITTVLFFSVWGEAYGRTHLGQIQSVAQMMTVLASALGPVVFAECFEKYHSYAPAFQVLSGIVTLLAVWSVVVHMPSPAEASEIVRIFPTLANSQESAS